MLLLSRIRSSATLGLLALCSQAIAQNYSDDTPVYHIPGKDRVHVDGCKRYQKMGDVDKETVVTMTFAEAQAKGLKLCSRCPGSTTAGKGNPEGVTEETESSVQPEKPGAGQPTETSKSADASAGTITVYLIPGKNRTHVAECKRFQGLSETERASAQKMTQAEAEAKGLPLCSRCPGSTTPKNGKEQSSSSNGQSFESWVNPPPAEVKKKSLAGVTMPRWFPWGPTEG